MKGIAEKYRKLNSVVRLAGSVLRKKLRQKTMLTRALWAVRSRTGRRIVRTTQRPHRLPRRLFVSLTSYPARFPTLHLTLRSLINQTVAPDGILLWIAHQDMAQLPEPVRALQDCGVIIRSCDDLRSYKKLIFALEEFPEDFLVTADDDLYYPPHWLETLVGGFDPDRPVVTCHRVHRIKWDSEGHFAPYGKWEKNVHDDASRTPSADLIPTTGHGVLYFPGCFSPEVSNRGLFLELAPEADDLWFYWMTRRSGSYYQKVGQNFPWVAWPTSQRDSLFSRNGAGGNDQQIASLMTAFGRPGPTLNDR